MLVRSHDGRPVSGRGRTQLIAGAAALGVFLVLLLGLRLRSWLPFVGAALAYLALLWALRGGARERPRRRVPLPDGIARADYDAALAALGTARRELAALGDAAPRGDAALVQHMARLVGAIRRHHEANPAHLARTRTFVRHTLGRMVAAVAGYVDLARRAGPAGDERLAEIRRRLDGFVPVLERIDRACLENDLMALEISVEVLDEQLGRDRDT